MQLLLINGQPEKAVTIVVFPHECFRRSRLVLFYGDLKAECEIVQHSYVHRCSSCHLPAPRYLSNVNAGPTLRPAKETLSRKISMVQPSAAPNRPRNQDVASCQACMTADRFPNICKLASWNWQSCMRQSRSALPISVLCCLMTA